MNYDEFVAEHDDKVWGYPTGSYVGECLSLVKLYIQEVFGIDPPASGTGTAYGYWSNFPDPLGEVFEKINNCPTCVPVKGDIVLWKPWVGNAAGHIAIFDRGDANSFVSFDANYGGKQAHFQNHNYDNVIGWLHPKGDQVTKDQAYRIIEPVWRALHNYEMPNTDAMNNDAQNIANDDNNGGWAMADLIKNWIADSPLNKPCPPADCKQALAEQNDKLNSYCETKVKEAILSVKCPDVSCPNLDILSGWEIIKLGIKKVLKI